MGAIIPGHKIFYYVHVRKSIVKPFAGRRCAAGAARANSEALEGVLRVKKEGRFSAMSSVFFDAFAIIPISDTIAYPVALETIPYHI